jgi:hypothetical protein
VASIEKPKAKVRTKSSTAKTDHPDFYGRLLEWRSKKSHETGQYEPKILLQKVMLEIADILPSTAAELKAVKGMGGKKMEQFGQELLALIMDYRSEKKMELPDNAQLELQIAGLDTREMSYMFFKQGLQPAEIAKKRKLAVSTIETHLSHFVATGKLSVFDLIDSKKYNSIAQIIKDNTDSVTITEIKNSMSDEVTYGEIRLVMTHLNRKNV